MKVHYIMDEGLACPCETGVGLDTVGSLQSAIKYLVKSKDVLACEAKDIEVYPLGVTKEDYVDKTPLKPEDKLPTGTSPKNALFVHVPRDYQDLTPEERRLYANPPYAPASPKKQQPMARPAIEKLTIKPKPKPKPKAKPPPPPEPEPEPPREPTPPPKDESDDIDASLKMDPIKNDYTPEPMDMSTLKCYYQLGDTIAYYIRINGWEKVGQLKERILETRGGRNCPYLDGVTDASVLKVFPPGQNEETGKELQPDETIPTGSSFDKPLIVIK